jgi:cellulose synthase/poly-beta-1,6-N-acetylglucosamine synthase-like glycosyltransferase
LYPKIARFCAWLSKVPENAYTSKDSPELPTVSLLISAYNEEKVIREKLECLQQLDYPTDKLRIFIGSDASADQTASLVENTPFAPFQLWFKQFPQRRGKPSVINELAEIAKNSLSDTNNPHILIINDANVLPRPETIFELVKLFKNPIVGLVDSNICPPPAKQGAGIAASEQTYISGEVKLKHWEGKAWGAMIGPLGGCYAVRAECFRPIPANALVDDFYVGMQVLGQGFWAVNSLKAVCYEDNPSALSAEFRRKMRISSGNFQNLETFWRLLLPTKRFGIWFGFWSHKILRWLGGFLMLTAFLSAGFLGIWDGFYTVLFGLEACGVLGMPFLGWLLPKCGISIPIIEKLSYFLWMNLAMMYGFFKYIKGGLSGIWQPTART